MKKGILILLISVVFSPPCAFALDENTQTVGTYPFGRNEAVAVDSLRHLSFNSSGGAVVIYDIGNASAPVKLSESIQQNNLVFDLDYDSVRQLLYVSAGDLIVYDVSNPNIPVEISRLIQDSTALQPFSAIYSAIEGDILYTVGGISFHAINISNPTNPVLRGSISFDPVITGGLSLGLNGIAVKDSILYITGTQRDVRAIKYDIATNTFTYLADSGWSSSSGRNPFVVGNQLFFSSSRGGLARVELPITGPIIDNTVDFPSYSALVATQDNVGYVTRYVNTNYNLDVVDITNPIDLPVLASFSIPSFTVSVAATEQTAVVLTRYADTHLYDVSNIYAPVDVATLKFPTSFTRIHVDNNIAYSVAPTYGLILLDISDKTQPRKISELTSIGPQDVAINNNLAYIVGDQNLYVTDLSDNFSPTIVNTIALIPPASAPTSLAYRIASNGKILLTAIGSEIDVFSISNPTQPTHLTRISTEPGVRGLQLVGNTAVIAAGNNLTLMDMSIPTSPKVLGTQYVFIIYNAILRGNLVYASAAREGMYIYDVSNPSNIKQLGFVNTIGTLNAIAVDGNFAFTADGYTGVQIWDISNPTNPVRTPPPSAINT